MCIAFYCIGAMPAIGGELTSANIWLTEDEMQHIRKQCDFERAYSFAVIGDTQYLTELYPKNLRPIYEWIVKSRDTLNIGYVMGLGDITNRDTLYEWDTAKAAVSLLDGKVPYSLVRGNHDIKSYNAEQNTKYHHEKTGKTVPLGKSTGGYAFDKYFATDPDYTAQFEAFGGSYQKGSVTNTWRLLDIEASRWLLLNLDYAPSDDVLKWACNIIAAHPERQVLITTHSYLDTEEDHTEDAGVDIWQKLVKKYSNIKLVLCGHIGSAQIITSQKTGIFGNTVTEMLIDPQICDNRFGGVGLVAMLYFNREGTKVSVEYLSTAGASKGLYYRAENQFSIDLF